MYNILFSIIAEAAFTAVYSNLETLSKKMSRQTYTRIRRLCYKYNRNNKKSQYALLECVFRYMQMEHLEKSDKNDLELFFITELCNMSFDTLIYDILCDDKAKDILLDRFVRNYKLMYLNQHNNI